MRKTFTRLCAIAFVAATATAIVGIGSPAQANEATRPYFQAPFSCGSAVRMETGPSHDNYHNGVWRRDKALDMYNPPSAGTAVLASAAGTVSHLGGSTTATMYVDHGNGWRTMYTHMANRVANGSWVNRGQQVGTVSNVGTGAAHLHYEQQYNGTIASPKLNGRSWRLSNGDPYSANIVSHLCSGMQPTTWCPYRVTTSHDKRSWAGAGFDAEGWVAAGTTVNAGSSTYSFDGATTWRRITQPTGADQRGTFLRSAYLSRIAGGCFS